MKTLNFYFDYVSNNAYLAWYQLDKLCQAVDINVEPRPVLFAGLLNAHGNVGPAEIPAKRTWMLKNILRKCALNDVPISAPIHHPFNPLLALRVSCFDVDIKTRRRLIDALFKAVWLDRLHISDPDLVGKIVQDVGLDAERVLAWARSPEAANVLRRQTDEAVEKGVFGIPSMLIEDELFFGYDDFPFIEQYIQGRDPLDARELKQWELAELLPSSVRKIVNHGPKTKGGTP